jgi:HD-GYP domain-containing protein (c-di-GMP phosphodiesterase class II)
LGEVEVAARLHDVGKIGVPDAILRKRGPLDPDEWRIVRQHPEWGSQMLARVPELAGIAVLIRYEHERWDGKGYPDGLAGEEIPLASRIVFVCDAYHAITSTRPYRQARSSEEALQELEANAGSQFDPEAVRALSRVVAA